MRSVYLAAVGFLALVLIVPPGAAFTVTLLDTPDVIVANEANETYRNPDYPFSAKIEARNDGEERNVTFSTITYLSRDVEDCPKDRSDTPRVDLVEKRYQMSPNEAIEVGGTSDASKARENPKAYWPMAVSREYRTQDGSVETYEEGTHAFCVNALDTDCAGQEGNTVRDCSLDQASWTAYVRRTNEAPHIQSWSITPEAPRPGQSIKFQAQAVDNSTQPREDTLLYTWKFAGEEKTGKVVRHTFPIGGEHTVRLTVSDGFDTDQRQRNLSVFDPGEGPGDGTNGSPGVSGLALVGCLVGVAAALRRRSSS